MIACTCESCGNELRIPDKYAGQRGKCKRCGEALHVPQCDDPACPATSGIPPLKREAPTTQQIPPSEDAPGTSPEHSTAQSASPEPVAAFVPMAEEAAPNPAMSALENLNIDAHTPIVSYEKSEPDPTGLTAFFHPKNKGHLKLMGGGAVLALAGGVWFGIGLAKDTVFAVPVFLILAGLLCAVLGLLIKHQAASKKA
ncbi:MAG: hypothetical protein GY851_30930 [bacterium]|nr:hypothetical protein [bacterium]